MKAMATMARHHMVMITGDTLMKLLTQPQPQVHARLEQDRVRWRDLPFPYPGTAVGIDITVDSAVGFSTLLSEIRKVYSLRIKEQKKAKYKARFL